MFELQEFSYIALATNLEKSAVKILSATFDSYF
jgi:hypothetical protein